jgi:hypothetical protein
MIWIRLFFFLASSSGREQNPVSSRLNNCARVCIYVCAFFNSPKYARTACFLTSHLAFSSTRSDCDQLWISGLETVTKIIDTAFHHRLAFSEDSFQSCVLSGTSGTFFRIENPKSTVEHNPLLLM